MRTKIELLSSGTIDLMDDVPYSINFAIADIRNPEKRDSSFSKTILIPGSKNNDQLFQFIFEIDIDCNFNPNIKAPCIITIDGIPQLSGFMQLLRIYKTDDNKVEYEITIRGQVGSIITKWGDSELKDLDFSEFNHYYLKSVQQVSWSASVGVGYLYPLIDFGKTNGTEYNVEDFYPAIYVKQYIDKMFALAGYSYNSNFFNSNFFKRLIIPANTLNLRLTQSQIIPRLFSAFRNSNQTETPTSTTIVFQAEFNDETNDPSNQYDITTYKLTNANFGDYRLIVDIELQDIYVGSGGAISTDSTSDGNVKIKRIRSGVTTTVGMINFDITHNGLGTTPSVSNICHVVLLSGILRMEVADEYYVEITRFVNTGTSTGNYSNANNWHIRLRDGGLFYNQVVNEQLFDGEYVDMQGAIPLNIKIRDFFSSIIKMFNLYVEEDKNTSNLLNIEPRNDFYSSGTIIDWTSKLDLTQALIQEPMGELDAVRYRYSYKEDVDYWNAKYKNAHNQIYSEHNEIIQNDFLKNTNLTEVIFAPTPQVQLYGTDRILPQIIKTNNSGSIEQVKGFVLRILYYGGIKTSSFGWWYRSTEEGDTIESDYPYCGMIDDATAPTQTLDFGVPFELYYFTSLYTNNNLFNKYYKQFIEEITNKDSKIITGWFALTPKDILLLDFRNEFNVDGHRLRLNKIYDYNPVISTLTKCEFIKIKQANSFVADNEGDTGPVDATFTDGVHTPVPIGGELPPLLRRVFVADGNVVDETSRSCIVTGIDNYVGADCENISILASSGCVVSEGLIGVTLINSSGVIVTESNITYIQNIAVDSGSFSGVTPTLAQVLTAGYTMAFTDVINNADNSGQFSLGDTAALFFHSILAYIQSSTKIELDAPKIKITNGTASTIMGLNAQKEITPITYSSGVIYTPTLTNVANISASTAYSCQYHRIGNIVTVSGKVDVDPTLAATSTQLGISLPIASNFTAEEQCCGTAFAKAIAGQGAAILADTTNDRAQMQWISADITNQAMYFQFTYRVI